eukprot:3540106-Amphidinium_carterae.1
MNRSSLFWVLPRSRMSVPRTAPITEGKPSMNVNLLHWGQATQYIHEALQKQPFAPDWQAALACVDGDLHKIKRGLLQNEPVTLFLFCAIISVSMSGHVLKRVGNIHHKQQRRLAILIESKVYTTDPSNSLAARF